MEFTKAMIEDRISDLRRLEAALKDNARLRADLVIALNLARHVLDINLKTDTRTTGELAGLVLGAAIQRSRESEAR